VKLPPLFERNPDFKMSFVQYAVANLNDLSAELLLAYLHDMALPALLKEYREELDFPEYTMFQLLQEHRLTKLSVPGIYRWMQLLRFKYETRQKCYYVDGHEKPDTKACRKKFVLRRYFEYEKLMHQWIQIELTEKQKLEEQEGIDMSHGHHYIDPTTKLKMVLNSTSMTTTPSKMIE
jgi:hypothetical protein